MKTAAKTSGLKKWQDMWKYQERGRGLFQFRPKLGYQLKHSFDSQSTENWLSKLRTCYADLNSYQHKLGLKDGGKCDKVGNRPVNMSIDQTSGHYWL